MTSFSPPSKNVQGLRIFLTKRVGKLRDDAKKIRNRFVSRGFFEVFPLFHAHVIFRPLCEVTFIGEISK